MEVDGGHEPLLDDVLEMGPAAHLHAASLRRQSRERKVKER
jgi:hypothetical protein